MKTVSNIRAIISNLEQQILDLQEECKHPESALIIINFKNNKNACCSLCEKEWEVH